jgi:hypothetical protein
MCDLPNDAAVPLLPSLPPLQPGLLSQALRTSALARSFGRAMSLSNLLDAPALPADGVAVPTDAAAGRGGDTGSTRKGRAPPQWASKAAVIELLNELLDELEGIDHQIAAQSVEHIHANEVRGCY